MASLVVHGNCAYCLNHRKLALSHAIPNAFFKEIFRKDSGKAVFVSEKRGIHTDKESGKAHLLCENCEKLFAHNLDTPAINFMKGFRQQIDLPGSSRRTTFDTDLLARFVLSVLWRALVSGSPLYENSDPKIFNPGWLKPYLLDKSLDPFEVASYLIRNVVDDIADSSADLLCPPVFTWTQYKDSPKPHLMNAFVVHGFSFQVFFPRLPAVARLKAGQLKKGTQITVPDLPMLKCHSLYMGMMNMMHMQATGKSSLRD